MQRPQCDLFGQELIEKSYLKGFSQKWQVEVGFYICRNTFECKRGGVRYVGPTKLVQNGQPALLTMTFMWLQIGIRQPVPPEISFSWKKKQRFVTILQKKHEEGLFALLRLKHQRRGKYNLMAAAKKLSNDLMPFSFKNSCSDLMSFCSKEWVDRLGWIGSAQIPVKSLSWKMQLHILLLLSPENNRTLLYVKYEELKMMIQSDTYI